MDIEKFFPKTTNSDILIEGHFFMNNLITRLVILSDSLYFTNDKV
jgi:hypothetical protein